MARKDSKIFTTTFSTYTAKKLIGEGGAARVYEVVDDDGRPFAIKVLSYDKQNKERIKRFKNECMFCIKNNHPNVISVIEYGVLIENSKSSPFYVMNLYQGSLRKLMERGIPQSKILSYFAQMLDGVECAHFSRIIHRDLKPENILVDQANDRLIIGDFGIAHFREDELFTAVSTKDNSRLANFQYAAPEQRQPGASIDQRADIYALGLILNEMFTGTIPAGTSYKTIAEVAPEYEYLDDLVAEMLHQEPQARPSTVDKIKGALIARKNEFVVRQRISEIQNTVIPVGEIDDPLITNPLELTDFDWDNNRLILTLSQAINEKWNTALLQMGGHTAVSGYGPGQFRITGDKAMIPVEAHLVKDVIKHFKTWLPIANAIYKRQIEREYREAEKTERIRLENELQMQEARSRLLNEIKL